MQLPEGKKIYFASDLHLGVPNAAASLQREKLFVQWLEEAAKDAAEIFIVGDLFDFWFEYKHAVPRGYVRLLGTLARLCDSGLPIHLFTGNHDMWIFDYLPAETGVTVHREPIYREWNGQRFYIGHGDGLGPGDHGYKFIKKVFASPVMQWLFARLHPNFGIGMAEYFSRSSRAHTGDSDAQYFGEEGEWLISYCRTLLQKEKIDYFIFGHRHLPIQYQFPKSNSVYINLGDWLRYYTYALYDGKSCTLRHFPSKTSSKIPMIHGNSTVK